MSLRAAISTIVLAGALLAIAGCDTRPPPAPGIDAFRADTGVDAFHAVDMAVDADAGPPPPDMGTDTGPPIFPDTGMDAAADTSPGIDADIDMGSAPDIDTGIDTGIAPGDSGRDGGPDTNFDAYDCVLPDGAPDLCTCHTFGSDCSATACATGESCVSDPCGHHCVAGGSACADDVDCPTPTMCSFGYCEHDVPCHDSRNCALGFACEAGACVDRRIPCSADANCPFGYLCDTDMPYGSFGTCIRLSRPCTTSMACTSTIPSIGNQICTDINGDGSRECQFMGGPCMRNVDCAAVGVVCSPQALTGLSVCGRFGPCNTVTDCAAGMQCRDLWGDGVRECVMTGGCTNTASCPAQQVCATPRAGGSPMCLAGG